jgi:hypothetical protein
LEGALLDGGICPGALGRRRGRRLAPLIKEANAGVECFKIMTGLLVALFFLVVVVLPAVAALLPLQESEAATPKALQPALAVESGSRLAARH